MTLAKWFKKYTVDIGYYLLTILLTYVILEFVAGISSINWHIPFSYSGDTNFILMAIKTLLKGEWFPFISPIKSSYLAAPFGLEFGDWPSADGLFYIIIKCISFFYNDYIAVYNVYFILTFFLSSTLFVFAIRQLNINYPIAIVCGILFTFQSYHFARLGHLFLASYFMIPLMTVILIWIWDTIPIFFTKSEEKLKINPYSYKAIFTTIIVILSGWTGVYYVFFFCFFAVVASLSAYFYNSKSYRHLISGGIIICLAISSFMLNFLPNFIYIIRYGYNSNAFQRIPIEAEMYGLRIISLFMPPANHRVGLLQTPMKIYSLVPHPEMPGSYLGFIAGLGLLFLIFRFIFIRRKECIYDHFSVLSITGILLSTISGFGLIFASLISPNIRAYSRISIFFASFGLFTVALLMNGYIVRIRRVYAFIMLFTVLLIGVLDQTVDFRPSSKNEFTSDSLFIHKIEKQAGIEGNIFQLPFVPFPEVAPILGMQDLSHFRGYLHSNTLHWTYGAVKGRPEVNWYESMSKLTRNELLNRLSIIDFSGIYIDRYAYPDQAKSIENEFSQLLHIQPLVSNNERLSYFNINSYKENFNSKFSTSELTKLKKSYLSLSPTMKSP